MSEKEEPTKTPSEHPQTMDTDQSFVNQTSSPPKTEDFKASPSTEKETEKKTMLLPSHSPLAYSNYPPLWSPNSTQSSRPKPQRSSAQQYTSAESMKAILNTGSSSSSSSKKSEGRFEERDPSNQHQYLQGPDRRYTHPRLNIFGRDIASSGKSSLFGGRGKKGKK